MDALHVLFQPRLAVELESTNLALEPVRLGLGVGRPGVQVAGGDVEEEALAGREHLEARTDRAQPLDSLAVDLPQVFLQTGVVCLVFGTHGAGKAGAAVVLELMHVQGGLGVELVATLGAEGLHRQPPRGPCSAPGEER